MFAKILGAYGAVRRRIGTREVTGHNLANRAKTLLDGLAGSKSRCRGNDFANALQATQCKPIHGFLATVKAHATPINTTSELTSNEVNQTEMISWKLHLSSTTTSRSSFKTALACLPWTKARNAEGSAERSHSIGSTLDHCQFCDC